MAAYSMVRIQCCETVAPVHFTFDLACPIDAALGEWEKALKTRDATIIEEAIEGYHRSVRCLSQFGQSPNFGKDGPPGAGVTGLKRMIKRVFPD
jgi:hypothetical protein